MTKTEIYREMTGIQNRLRRLPSERYDRVAERVRGHLDAARGALEFGDLDGARRQIREAETEITG